MSDESRIVEILGEWRQRRDRGDAEDAEAVCRAHPELADELRTRFAAMELVDRALAAARDPAASLPGTLGEFRLVREIGRGGMGVVYEAVQETLGRRVALKVLSPSVTISPRSVDRFRREARAAGRLNHTSIVSVHAMGEEAGLFYYAMEYVDGRPLSAAIEAARSDGGDLFDCAPGSAERWRRIAARIAGVAEALDAAHRAGVVHRDVKPGNLLCDGNGVLKLADFGLARVEEGGLAMTLSGSFVGTPMYMSPEQARARNEVDHRTDVYSLGATLYELLTLRPPVTARSFPEAYTQVIEGRPARPREIDPRIPKDLETVVLMAMQKRKEDRYPTAGDLARDLRRFVEGVPVLARRPGPLLRLWRAAARNKAVAGLTAAILLLAAAVLWFGTMWAHESELRQDFERRWEGIRHVPTPARPKPLGGSED